MENQNILTAAVESTFEIEVVDESENIEVASATTSAETVAMETITGPTQPAIIEASPVSIPASGLGIETLLFTLIIAASYLASRYTKLTTKTI